MKKFISALTSVALAATAMSSVLSMSASAAVSSTIFDIRTGDSNAYTVSASDIAAGDVTIPVSIYIPQSQGINTITMKLAVNGDETIQANGLFDNYGITLQNAAEGGNSKAAGYAATACLDAAKKGNVAYQKPLFVPEYYSFSYMNNNNISSNVNCDNWAAKESGAGDSVTEWSSSDDFAYTYAFAKFDMVLPKGLADGTYTLDIYTKDYVNATSIGDPEPTYSATYIAGVAGEVNLVTKPLVVTVGTPGSGSSSSTTSTTTTSTSSSNVNPGTGDGMKLYGDTVTAKPGDKVKFGFKVSDDPGTAGMQLFFDFGALTNVDSIAIDGDEAYIIEPTWNAAAGSFVWGGSTDEVAEDGGYLVMFEGTVPANASGDIKVTLSNAGKNAIRNRNMQDVAYTFTPAVIKIDGGSSSSSSSTTSTTISSDTPDPGKGMVIYGDTISAKAGETVKAGFKVKNDPGTAGMQLFFDTTKAEIDMISIEGDEAYIIEPTWNGKVGSFVWGGSSEEVAEDDGYLVFFSIKVPADASGKIEIGLNKSEKNAIRNLNMQDVAYTVTPITINVTSGETTTSSTTTSSTTSSTTTSSTTSSTTTSTSDGMVVWGDVNCDGKVSIADVVLLNKHNAQGATVSEQGLKNADCVNDNKLDSADAIAIKGNLAKFYGTDAFPFASLKDCQAKMK